MLVLNIDRKPYIRSPIALSHLTLNDLERSKLGSLRCEALYLIIEQLDPMWLLYINREPYVESTYESPMVM